MQHTDDCQREWVGGWIYHCSEDCPLKGRITGDRDV